MREKEYKAGRLRICPHPHPHPHPHPRPHPHPNPNTNPNPNPNPNTNPNQAGPTDAELLDWLAPHAEVP